MRRSILNFMSFKTERNNKSEHEYGRIFSTPLTKVLLFIGFFFTLFILVLATGYGTIFILNLLFPQ